MPRSTGRGKPRSPTPVTLGHAIEDAMHNAELVGTQERLAVMIGVDQTTVSKWIRGTVNITVARIADIEDACRLPRGQLYVNSGYVDLDAVEAATRSRHPATVTQLHPPASVRRAAQTGRPKPARGTRARPSPEPDQ